MSKRKLDEEKVDSVDEEVDQDVSEGSGKKRKREQVEEGVNKGDRKELKKGIVYISRPPPFMKPEKVKFLLGQYGRITNLYLAPESDNVRARRKKNGGSSKIKYTDGWVEFEDRRVARQVAESLNGQQVGGKRRNFHHSDLWTMKYLKGFKWTHLSERNAYEKQTKSSRLRAEISHAKRENEHYLEKLIQEKQIRAMVERKSDKKDSRVVPRKARRSFKQVESKSVGASGTSSKGGDDSWLGDVFG
mmetsp:Transcript_10886/g.17828  ORF Transcript_10886/g.17828 Transcript_10886/m.17828 type:complete len:246 (+) Transcript_10886:88-825(+)